VAFIRINNRVMHYALRGTCGAPRLVFINSLGTDFRIWDDVVAGLSADYEMLVYDKRGHGLSEGQATPCTIAGLAQDLAALLDGIGWYDGVTLVGLSVGGQIAMQMAHSLPLRLSRIVLMDTAAKIGTQAAWLSRMEMVERGGMAAISDTIVNNWFSANFMTQRPADYSGFRLMLERTPAQGYVAVCAALSAADLRHAVKAINLPVMVIAGDEDRATPVALVRDTAGLIAGAQFKLIENAGHLPCIEQPGQVMKLVAGFMEG